MGKSRTEAVLGQVDWEGLSDEGLWILQSVALPSACGLSHEEIAASLSVQRIRVRRWLVELGDELEAQAQHR